MSNSATSWTIAPQSPLSMGFPRKEYWKGLPIPSPVGLPDPGIKLESPALHVDYLPVSHWGIVNHSPKIIYGMSNYIVDFKSYIPL